MISRCQKLNKRSKLFFLDCEMKCCKNKTNTQNNFPNETRYEDKKKMFDLLQKGLLEWVKTTIAQFSSFFLLLILLNVLRNYKCLTNHNHDHIVWFYYVIIKCLRVSFSPQHILHSFHLAICGLSFSTPLAPI